MAQVWSDLAVKQLLVLWTAYIDGFKVRLFSNNYTPTDSTVIGDLTECTGGGYAAQTLVGATFPTPSLAAHVASSIYGANIVWTGNGAATVTAYGYYITDAGNTILYHADRFASPPLTLVNNGDTITLAPFTLTTQSLN